MIRPFDKLIAAFALLGVAGAAHAFGGMIAIGLGQAAEQGQVDVPFEADAVLQTEEYNMQTRIHYTPGKVRDEMNMANQDMVFIQRFDLGTTWMIMPQGFYMEYSQDQLQGEAADRVDSFRLVTREAVGEETVNGMQTTKYKVVYETSDGRFGGFTWFTDDNIAVKSLMVQQSGGEETRIRFEIKRLDRGSQPGALFELPDGARKFDMGNMAGMMDMMGGQAGQPPAVPGSAGAGAPPADDPASVGDDPSIAEKMGDAARDSAEDAAVEETRRGVGEAVGRGLRGLFGR